MATIATRRMIIYVVGIDINSCNILRLKILIRRHPDVKTVFSGKIVINMTIFGSYSTFRACLVNKEGES